ncbi:hypothetical protein CT676_43190 [Bradyrhizobium sp. MOS001]|jgi:hypothetical protein|uniref:hypothetical protein n=1 Tax=unclassified Bradyrhizobium TaxID=2631580 RepID=UPI0010757139|nr:hypothetical protein [Bradyrhizobium sp. MOS001]TFW51596.1 hypothetical protein CT676_43190 [Bradyrhizobium sp. MOS001]
MPDVDWEVVRKYRLSNERPPEWPEDVYAISIKGSALLGIHERSGKLYWDGKEIVTRNAIRLGTLERWIAIFAAVGTFGTFVVNAGRAMGKWS